MKTSKFFIATQKEVPAEAEIVSHRLMLRASLVRMFQFGQQENVEFDFESPSLGLRHLLALGIPCSAQLGVIMAMLGRLSPAATLIWLSVTLATILKLAHALERATDTPKDFSAARYAGSYGGCIFSPA